MFLMQYKRRIHSVGLTGLSTWMLVQSDSRKVCLRWPHRFTKVIQDT
nr:hypothetical protein [Escherichia coli]